MSARRPDGVIAEVTIGRIATPVLHAAIDEVKQDGCRNDRDAMRANGKSTPHFAQRRLNAGCGVEAEGRAAGQHDRIDALDGVVRLQQIGFAGARRTAEDLHGGNCRRIAEHNGYAGFQRRIRSVSDGQAADICDQVERAGPHQFAAARGGTGTKRPSSHCISW